MGSRATQIMIGLVVIIVIAVGAYALMHKSSSKAPTSTASNTAAVIQTKNSSSAGAYLANAKGQALYTYEKDTAGTSNCTGACLANWPAYVASGSTGSLPAHVATIKRADGSMQYAYDGMPLYTFTGDSKAGDVTGDGSEGFHIARPAGSATTQTTPAPSPAPVVAPAPTPTPTPTPTQAAPAPAPAPMPPPSSPYNY